MSNIKNLFNTPKKAIISSVCAIAILATIGTGTTYATGYIAKNSSIGSENAQNFAFADAGVDPASAKISRTEFDFENGHFVYDVEFIADGKEYEYQIKSSDGTILKKDVEQKSPRKPAPGSKVEKPTEAPSATPQPSAPAQQNGQNPTKASKASGQRISLADAKAKALADAGLSESAVSFIKQKLDYDDMTLVYDIEFYTSTHEYEYEINALTGAIHDKSIEKLHIRPSTKPTVAENQGGNSASYIGLDKAKELALSRAGLALGDVVMQKAKLEYDDGRVVYEIEFRKGMTEYDISINAFTGNIIEFVKEIDD